ncbi:MAG: hypothetical protein OEU52_17890, partial [Xanthomonadales bacterium]|nr:hypothetical protein [Xanthomonadales bacterium]
ETGPYTDELFRAFDDPPDNTSPYNQNPLAEQEAFTGPGLDLEGGSWGVSRVNLAGIAAAGDSIQLRFDFGIDECLGAVGWYVDDVEVYSCGETDGASLTLVNEVINDNGGTARASAWSLTADGPTVSADAGRAYQAARRSWPALTIYPRAKEPQATLPANGVAWEALRSMVTRSHWGRENRPLAP